MKFSVAIPAYKPEFLGEAIVSVLAQTYPGWELVIVDDCSPADLRAIVEPFLTDPRVRYYRNDRNIGALDLVDNWNHSLEYCNGNYVICIGDDDRLLPNCLEDLRVLIEKYPGLGVYHVQTEKIDSTGIVIEQFPKRPEYESALDMLSRRWETNAQQYIGDFCYDLVKLRSENGFYKLPLAWGADDVSAFRAAASGGIANTHRVGFQYRETSLSLSSNELFDIKAYAIKKVSYWFEKALSDYKPDNSEEILKLNKLQIIRPSYYKFLYGDYVKSDVGRHPSRLIYWIQHRKEFGLTKARILLQGLKGVIQHLLGML
ncbi:MAG: glycosyltransferase [Bacteroidales bacterium]|nr:glycosyltransferase [Bacteroidales bacterium]